MKRFVAALFLGAFAISLVGCGPEAKKEEKKPEVKKDEKKS